MANDPKKAIIEYANCLLKNQNLTLDLGTLKWVKYNVITPIVKKMQVESQ